MHNCVKQSGFSKVSLLQDDRNTVILSVIICTYNRAELLGMALEGLVLQTLGKEKFEVVIIDDGSSDDTRQVAESFAGKLPLRYFYQKNAGLASARDHGIYVSRGEILFFSDDDDIAAPTLLEEHLKMHDRYPQPDFAVLNYTGWADGLQVTPLMHFITEVGCFLFSYPYVKHGDILDYTYFWGGRVSCKRGFLIENGVFNPVFRFGCEDIELGYRLSKAGLKVVFNKNAVSFMSRQVTFGDFCNRLIKQGRSQYIFGAIHNDPDVQRWAEIPDAEKWPEIAGSFEKMKKAAMELEELVSGNIQNNAEVDESARQHLYKAYSWVFKACKIKGIVEAKKEFESRSDTLVANEKGYEGAHPEIQACGLSSLEDYKLYSGDRHAEYKKRRQFEAGLISDEKPFVVGGYCYVCRQKTFFEVDYSYSYVKDGIRVPNWREHLKCPVCGLSSRMRASVHLFERLMRPDENSRIYMSEQTTPLYRMLSARYKKLVGSEFLGSDVPAGKINLQGIRNESLTGLSFAVGEFDFVLSFDCFEHIPDYKKAFRECARVLKPGGGLLFSVPFSSGAEKNMVRAILKDSGEIEHILPPEYHGDPLNSGGCLAFHNFGWEMLEELKKTGFASVEAVLFWSSDYGYLGVEQVMFIAKKHECVVGNKEDHVDTVASENVQDQTLMLPPDQYQRYRMVADLINKFRQGDGKFSIIDVGAGPEEYLKKFLPADIIYCLDKDYPQELAQRGNFISGDITRLNLDKKYDFVVSLDCYEHIEPSGRGIFINKLVDASRIATLIAAPFDTEGVKEMEIRANELYKSKYGTDYKWLQEHIQNGLPSLEQTLEQVKVHGYEPVIIPNGYLPRWYEMISLCLILGQRSEFTELLQSFFRFYNINFYLDDNKGPAYRQVLVINKTMGREIPTFDDMVSTRLETEEGFVLKKKLLAAYLAQINCLLRAVESEEKGDFLKELDKISIEVKDLENELKEKNDHEATVRDSDGRYQTKWVNFEFCSSCNLRCKWCSLDHSKKRILMTPKIMAKALDELASNPKFNIERIDLHNAGEVLLHPDLEKMLSVIKTKIERFSHKPTIHLLTNATLLDESRSKVITGAEVLDEIRFSIDGGNRENYEEIRSGAKWEMVKHNVLNFFNKNGKDHKKIKTGAICIVPPEMPRSTDWMADDFKELFSLFDNVELRYPHNWDGSKDLCLERNIYKVEGQICKFLLKNLVVLPNGDVTVCCADLNSRGVIGKIGENSLEEIFLSEKRLNMLDLYRCGKKENINLCKNCEGYYE